MRGVARSLVLVLVLALAACTPPRLRSRTTRGAGGPTPPASAAVPQPMPSPPIGTGWVPLEPPPGSILEQRTYGGDASVNGGSLDSDARGNLFAVGSFRGTATFGSLPALVSEQEDAFLVKLAPSGEALWSKRFGGTGLDYGSDVVVGADGHIYVSGSFESPTIDLGGEPLRCAGIHDLFLAKLTGDGQLVWAKRYGDARDQIDLQLEADPAGGVAATGWFNGTVDFGAGPVARPWNKTSFVARIDANGRARWSSSFGHRRDYAGTDSAFDPSGQLHVIGGSDGTAEFVAGGNPAAYSDLGPVLLTFDAGGKQVSGRRFGKDADNISTAIAVDPAGGVRIATASRGLVDFGAGSTRPNNGEIALVLSSFDATGAVSWSRPLRQSASLSVAAARVDAKGDTVLVGQFTDRRARTSGGFATKVDTSGAVLWSLDMVDDVRIWLSGMTVDPDGRIIASGSIARRDGPRVRNGLVVVTIAP